jgi:type I restriction enzyme S subunit
MKGSAAAFGIPMALCDQLEASLTTTTTRSKLLGALLHEALERAADAITEAAE